MYKPQLLQKLTERRATIGIIGLGYVGLPLAVAFAEAGFNVLGVDVLSDKVDKLNQGISYIPDIPTPQIEAMVRAGKFRATTNYDDLREVDAVSICVPTPLRKTKDPDMSYVINSADAIAKIVHPGMLIVLESTTYPGTTDEIMVPRVEERGFVVGETVFVAFSPERIDPANKKYGVRNTPKVVGGVTPACQEVVAAYYSAIADEVVVVSSPTTAEMVKLLENTFRAVNIGLVNEVALMCNKLGINVWEVIRAAASKPFGFMPFYPGPGLGGHCIPIDPLYLSWKLKALNYNSRFIELASEINTSMPMYVVDRVAWALNDDGKAVKGAKIGVIGVAYKRDVDDVRESPALDIIQLLQERGAQVTFHDPYVESVRLEHDSRMHTTALTEAWLAGLDCTLIVTDHTTLDYQWIVDHSQLVVDTRNAAANVRGGKARIVSL